VIITDCEEKMFNRSRRKIILSIMGSLILLFVATMTVILFASYREIRQNNQDMLRQYADMYYLESEEPPQDATGGGPGGETAERPTGAPGERPTGKPDGGPGGEPGERPTGEPGDKPDGDPGERPGGSDPSRREPPPEEKQDFQLSTFYAVALGEDDTALAVDTGEREVYTEDELTNIAKSVLASGASSGKTGDLTYLVDHRPNYTLVAFMDNTVTDNSMRMLVRNVLIVGGAAIVVLFFLSLFLSKWIIHPLEENDRQQRQFISDASHELKTPVAVIGANAEMLSREIGKNEWLGNIQYENERMGELVKQLLDLSRAEKMETTQETIDFSRVVTGEVLAFESLAFDQGRIIRSEIEEGVVVLGNQSQLTQLVSVLLDNAIRYAEGEEIEISLKQAGHDAVLSVVNDGEEIPREKREHLFDRFYRIDEARNSEGQHYGLGLSIARAVAEGHRGKISVSCQKGKICFTASIPVKS